MQNRKYMSILGTLFLAACSQTTALPTSETTLEPTKAPLVPTSNATLAPIVYAESPCDYIAKEQPEEPAFKGMELYSWQNEDGDWVFSILYGTNRNKGIDEIESFAMNIAEVEECFAICQIMNKCFGWYYHLTRSNLHNCLIVSQMK